MRPSTLNPGDLVEPQGNTHGGVMLWPDYEYTHLSHTDPKVHLKGIARARLDGVALVLAVLEWPDVVDGRIVLLLYGNHLGYNRELFLKVVE